MKKTKTTETTKTTKLTQENKTHKQNWRETYASPEEIKEMLKERVLLRYNEVRGRPEIHYLSKGPVIAENELGLLSIFGGDEGVSDGYENLGDRDVNSLWVELCKEKPIRMQDLRYVLGSDYVPKYHPFRFYLDNLPRGKTDEGNAILDLAMTVKVKGDEYESARFYLYLKKWLVGMVASWVEPSVVNQTMLVLIGEQGVYKTTWFQHLLPPQLQHYFKTKSDSGFMSKDDMIVLAQYGLVCWEELDSMQAKELNKLKAAMTMRTISERAAYAHYHENLPHIASFCGTGNNLQFLSDTTGTRRWLPFEVESIVSPLTTPFDHDAIYAEAYGLYKQGFQYWFSSEEIAQLQQHNERFEVEHSELYLVDLHFRKPEKGEEPDLVSATYALQLIGGNISNTLNRTRISQAFAKLGFEYKHGHAQRGYKAIHRTGVEMENYRKKLAEECDTATLRQQFS